MYNSKQLKKALIERIKKDGHTFLVDLCSEHGISDQTFYNHFPRGSADNEEIVGLMRSNRAFKRRGIRSKWEKEGSPAETIALYKLLVDDPEELAKLSVKFDGKIETKLEAGESILKLLEENKSVFLFSHYEEEMKLLSGEKPEET